MPKEFYREGDVEQEVSAFLQHFDPHATFFRDHFLNIASTIAERAPLLRPTSTTALVSSRTTS